MLNKCYSLFLPIRAGQGLPNPLKHLSSSLMPATKYFNWHWLKDNAFSLAGLPIFPPLLFISVLKSISRLFSSSGHQLCLETADHTYIYGTVAATTEKRQENIGRTAFNTWKKGSFFSQWC